MIKNSNYIVLSALAGIIASIGEFVALFLFGASYPGYNQMKDTMSSLGASISPVSAEISLWWVFMGILLIFYSIGFRKAFQKKDSNSKIASWLIILYGFGEGIGSAAFKANHGVNGLETSAIFHDILGGIGVVAILILPILMRKVVPRNESQAFYRLTNIVFIVGIITIFLFLFRYSKDPSNFLTVYKGLWQRLFMLNTYVYLTVIAVRMIRIVVRNPMDQ